MELAVIFWIWLQKYKQQKENIDIPDFIKI